MHLLYCDETNLEERSGVFFVYGGVSIEANAALKQKKGDWKELLAFTMQRLVNQTFVQ